MKEPGLSGDTLQLTLRQLREMAARQQQQLDSQHQLLSAREQRLHFLKQSGTAAASASAQGAADGTPGSAAPTAADVERLRRLHERVDAQEQKLRKLRALRGQVDGKKLSNAALTSDLDSIRALFNEKEKELSLAVAKVEELTMQLEELRRGRRAAAANNGGVGGVNTNLAAAEVEKLRRELMYRNKLNEQQNAQISQQRETLSQRQEEMSEIDRRISELQDRLHRKRLLNQQLANQITAASNKAAAAAAGQPHLSNKLSLHRSLTGPGPNPTNIAAVEPYHHVPSTPNSHHHDLPPDPEKPPRHMVQAYQQQQQPAPVNAHLVTTHKLKPPEGQVDVRQGDRTQDDFHMKVLQQKQIARTHPLNNNTNNINNNINNNNNNSVSPSDAVQNNNNINNSNNILHLKNSPVSGSDKDDFLLEFTGSKSDPKYQTLPYNTKFASGSSVNSTPMSSTKNVKLDNEKAGNESHQQQYQHNKMPVPSSTTTTPPTSIAHLAPRVFNQVPAQNHCGMPSNRGPSTSCATSSASTSTPPVQSHQVGFVGLTATPSWTRKPGQASVSCTPATTVPQPVPTNSTLSPLSPPLPSPAKAAGGASGPPGGVVGTADVAALGLPARPTFDAGSVVLPPTLLTLANQKPVSCVAPTSVQHQKPSPIYQTSSMKVHPVQPQTLSSTPQGVLRLSPSQSSATTTSTTATCAAVAAKPALPPKPAAPVKPTSTPPPPPRQTQLIAPFACDPGTGSVASSTPVSGPPTVDLSAEVVDSSANKGVISLSVRGGITSQSDLTNQQQNKMAYQPSQPSQPPTSQSDSHDYPPHTFPAPPPPPAPTTDPPDENNGPTTNQIRRSSVPTDNQPIKPRPLAIAKKQSATEQLRPNNVDPSVVNNSNNNNNNINNNSNTNNNSIHLISNRRIEMPPAFLFPETGATTADLITTRDDRQMNGSVITGRSTDEVDCALVLNKENNNQLLEKIAEIHQEDNSKSTDSSGCSSEGGVVEALNNINLGSSPTPVIGDVTNCNVTRRVNKKGNLKSAASGKVSVSRRVSFDPLALLLDASLEGELELVRRTAIQVANASAANDEGITALHNAICAGHLEIVKFLVEFGCDVNAQDSDGWTPLHCAASCNNLAMVRFLVEHGACIFATTLSDHETAAEKCEEDEEGYDGCSEYLYSVQEKLGILNGGVVYSVYDYEAHNSDELSFHEGEKLVVLRKGDEWEREWWWARRNDQEGYVPRNLLGLYPRVHGKKISE